MYDALTAPTGSPRLFFSADDLPAIRRKLAHPDLAPVWAKLLTTCRQWDQTEPPWIVRRFVRASHFAFAWLITGEETFAHAAWQAAQRVIEKEWSTPPKPEQRSWAGLSTGGALREVTLTLDWLHDWLSPEHRRTLRDALVNHGLPAVLHDIEEQVPAAEWYTCNGINVINGPAVMAALLLEGEGDEDPVVARTLDASTRQIRRAIDAHCPDGAYPEGPSYWNYGLRYMLMAVEPLRRLKGLDLQHEPLLRNTGDYLLHFILPHIDRCVNIADAGSFTKLWPPIAAFAALQRRTDWQWIARQLLTRDWGDDGEAIEYSLFFMLYYDPDLHAEPPAIEQRDKLFTGMQQLSWRSDWSRDAIHVVWLNGPSNCHHNHLHLNSFTLTAFGERLLTELGQYDYKDYQDQRRHTHGHNTVLVDGEGQIITTDEDIWCRRIRAGQWGTVYGEFQRYREEAGARIATGHVVNAYHDRLSRFDRTLAFLDHRVLLLHDRIELARDRPAELTWRFHTPGLVAIDAGAGRARFTLGEAQLDLHGFCTQPIDWRETDSPPQLDSPDQPIRRLDLVGRVAPPAVDLFMVLAPARAGAPTPVSIERDRQADDPFDVKVKVDGLCWRYDPARAKLRMA